MVIGTCPCGGIVAMETVPLIGTTQDRCGRCNTVTPIKRGEPSSLFYVTPLPAPKPPIQVAVYEALKAAPDVAFSSPELCVQLERGAHEVASALSRLAIHGKATKIPVAPGTRHPNGRGRPPRQRYQFAPIAEHAIAAAGAR